MIEKNSIRGPIVALTAAIVLTAGSLLLATTEAVATPAVASASAANPHHTHSPAKLARTSDSAKRANALSPAKSADASVSPATATDSSNVGANLLRVSTVNVSTAAQLTSALAQAQPGDVITLANGQYVGKFVTSHSGTAAAPITLTGSRNAVLTTGSTGKAYGLHVTGEYWNLTGFTVSTAHKGIVLDQASNSIIDGVEVGNIGQEGIHVRHNSSHVVVRNSYVHDTGQTSEGYGEGIYIGSSHNNWSTVMGSATTADQSDFAIVQHNTISNTAAEGIDVKEGTVGGQLLSNTFNNDAWSGKNSADSWVDVKGNGYLISGNSGTKTINDGFQVHQLLPGWGERNTFEDNSSSGLVPGYLVNVGWGATGNIVKCQSSTATRGLSNIACS